MTAPIQLRAAVFAGAVVALAGACSSQSTNTAKPATITTVPVPVTSAPGVPIEPISHDGRWLVDASGRVVVIHGVNVPSKSLPAYPSALGFGDDDAQLLASSGFNAVRLTVERYAVEPKPGTFDDAYLDHFKQTIAILARHGIVTLIDFHQDEFGPVFYDNGYPDWMTVTDGKPNNYKVGFPLQYLQNPALERAFDNLWANARGSDGKPLQTDDAALLSHVASHFAAVSGLVGYELINEPWPGTPFSTCFAKGVGCPTFDGGPYSAYVARMTTALRAADATHMIWYEPLVMFNYGVPTSTQAPSDPRLGFAFHDYPSCAGTSPDCVSQHALVVTNALNQSKKTGDALLETEFGATTDTAGLDSQLAVYDQHMIPWMFWSYTRYIDALTPQGSLKTAVGASVNTAMLTTLARPYPQLVSGTPLAWTFDPTTKHFTFRFTTDRTDGHGTFGPDAETDIAVPAVQYRAGYRVSVIGGRVISAASARTLRVQGHAGAHLITVNIANR